MRIKVIHIIFSVFLLIGIITKQVVESFSTIDNVELSELNDTDENDSNEEVEDFFHNANNSLIDRTNKFDNDLFSKHYPKRFQREGFSSIFLPPPEALS